MHNSISRQFARVGLALSFVAASLSVAVPAANAADCQTWGVANLMVLDQNNGYTTTVNKRARTASARSSSGKTVLTAQKVTFTSFTPDKIRFIISWSNNTSGIYEGRIDSDGFVSGRAADRFNRNTTSWRMRGHATCRG